MSGSYSEPPEYGIEPGETCWRGNCRGRMVYENGGCPCPPEDECDGSCDESVHCGVCGAEA